jgi:hypothetical protein
MPGPLRMRSPGTVADPLSAYPVRLRDKLSSLARCADAYR